MVLEIERKHLVANDGWRGAVLSARRLRQGYLARTDRLTVRVRITGADASLTIKTPRVGIVREEIEVPIALPQARELLAHCSGRIIRKVRHLVADHGQIWSVDEFIAPAPGLLLAEIELDHADQSYVRPDWAGAEVTFDPRYRNSSLAGLGRRRRAQSAARLSADPGAVAALESLGGLRDRILSLAQP